jgi:hypothetical protein
MSTNYLEYHQHLQEGLARLDQDLPGPVSGLAVCIEKHWNMEYLELGE